MKAKTVVTSSPMSTQVTSPIPDSTARSGQSAGQGPTADSVEIPLDVLDRIIDDLFNVGLALHAGAGNDDEERQNNSEAVLDGLDSIIARIRQSAVRNAGPARTPVSVAAAADASCQLQQPDLVALSSVPNGELLSIAVLDAAHNARRALIALQNSIDPEERPAHPSAVAVDPGPQTSADGQLVSSQQAGHWALADVAASGAQ